ncbi:MAG TPA: hypothetical protein VMH26_02575 [Burkholderiales bacterium]|nr:hypothetical protein [Burkholderiales bacterium]
MEHQNPHPCVAVRGLCCVAAALLLVAAAGCASKGAAGKPKVAASEIKVYQTPDLLQSQYTLIEHVWIDSWRINITSFPTFRSEADGMDAMKRVASDAGADALINAICLDGRSKPSSKPELYCYADAIRVN